MDKIVCKLKRKSTIKGNDFDYSIKGERKQSTDYPQIILNPEVVNYIEKLSNPNIPVAPNSNTRRSNRLNTAVVTHSTEKLKSVSFKSPTFKKDFFQIPINFSLSLLNSPQKILSPKSQESATSLPIHFDKIQISKSNMDFDMDNEENQIPELSSSQEISEVGYKRKGPTRLSRTISLSFEDDKSDFTISHDSPTKVSPKPYKTCASNTEIKSDQTQDTDKIPELKPVQLSQMRSKLTPSCTEISYMDFDEALKRFYLSKEIYTEAHLWIRGFSDYFCCCFGKKHELGSDVLELCEKVIVFAYCGFESKNIYHTSLLISVYHSLQELTEEKANWVDVGFSSNNPYDKDLTHNVATVGLLFIMFLYDYIPDTLHRMIKYCTEINLAFVPLAFDVSEIVILSLRKQKLNLLINQTQKCLETLCFFFAGCLAEWFSLHQEHPSNIRKIHEQLEAQAFDDPKSFIYLAKNLLTVQNVEEVFNI